MAVTSVPGSFELGTLLLSPVLSPVCNARRRKPLGEHDLLEGVAAIDLRQSDAEVSGACVVGDGSDADNDIQPMLVVGHAVGVANRRPIKGIAAAATAYRGELQPVVCGVVYNRLSVRRSAVDVRQVRLVIGWDAIPWRETATTTAASGQGDIGYGSAQRSEPQCSSGQDRGGVRNVAQAKGSIVS